MVHTVLSGRAAVFSAATQRGLSGSPLKPRPPPCAFNPSLSPTQGLLSTSSHCFLLHQLIIESFPSHINMLLYLLLL